MNAKSPLIPQLLFAEGLVFVALSLGWALGSSHFSKDPKIPIVVFFIMGLLGLFSSVIMKTTLGRKSDSTRDPLRPVDLDDSFKAQKAYGSQPPLFDFSSFRTEVFTIEGTKRFNWAHNVGQILIEHWGGAELRVQNDEGREALLQGRQVLRLNAKSKGGVDLVNSDSRDPTQLLIHYMGPHEDGEEGLSA